MGATLDDGPPRDYVGATLDDGPPQGLGGCDT